MSEIAKPTKVHPGKLGKYSIEVIFILSINNAPSSNPPPPCHKLYIYGGVPGRVC